MVDNEGMMSQNESDLITEKLRYGLTIRRATLQEVGRWLREQRTGVTFGDSSFTIRVYPYHLRSFDEGYMP